MAEEMLEGGEAGGWLPSLPVGKSEPPTILLVDDDDDVRLITATALSQLGYTVIQAADAEDALSIFRERPTIELLLTDLAMPGMGGAELAHIAKSMRPDLKVVYVSAHAHLNDPALRHGPLLAKPWTTDVISRLLRSLIGRP